MTVLEPGDLLILATDGTSEMLRRNGIDAETVGEDTDLVELYYERGFTDGLPVVPPTPAKIAAMVDALGGDPALVECRIPPRWGSLSREVLAINLVARTRDGAAVQRQLEAALRLLDDWAA